MKALLMVLFILNLNVSAYAEGLCESIETLARGVMTQRQVGTPLSLLMTTVEQQENGSFKDIVRQIFIGAYEVPLFESAEYKIKAVNEYGNKVIMRCYQGVADGQ